MAYVDPRIADQERQMWKQRQVEMKRPDGLRKPFVGPKPQAAPPPPPPPPAPDKPAVRPNVKLDPKTGKPVGSTPKPPPDYTVTEGKDGTRTGTNAKGEKVKVNQPPKEPPKPTSNWTKVKDAVKSNTPSLKNVSKKVKDIAAGTAKTSLKVAKGGSVLPIVGTAAQAYQDWDTPDAELNARISSRLGPDNPYLLNDKQSLGDRGLRRTAMAAEEAVYDMGRSANYWLGMPFRTKEEQRALDYKNAMSSDPNQQSTGDLFGLRPNTYENPNLPSEADFNKQLEAAFADKTNVNGVVQPMGLFSQRKANDPFAPMANQSQFYSGENDPANMTQGEKALTVADRGARVGMNKAGLGDSYKGLYGNTPVFQQTDANGRPVFSDVQGLTGNIDPYTAFGGEQFQKDVGGKRLYGDALNQQLAGMKQPQGQGMRAPALDFQNMSTDQIGTFYNNLMAGANKMMSGRGNTVNQAEASVLDQAFRNGLIGNPKYITQDEMKRVGSVIENYAATQGNREATALATEKAKTAQQGDVASAIQNIPSKYSSALKAIDSGTDDADDSRRATTLNRIQNTVSDVYNTSGGPNTQGFDIDVVANDVFSIEQNMNSILKTISGNDNAAYDIGSFFASWGSDKVGIGSQDNTFAAARYLIDKLRSGDAVYASRGTFTGETMTAEKIANNKQIQSALARIEATINKYQPEG
jgi:hypothetical protein